MGTDLAKLEDFTVLTTQDENVITAMQTNLGDASLSLSDFMRIKIPSAGGTMWMYEQKGKKVAAEVISGVIVGFHSKRVYWRQSMDEDGASDPDCFSPDGVTGYGDPGGKGTKCGDCPLSAWKSGKGGVGQACKDQMVLHVLVPDRILPIEISLPPTSIAPMRAYLREMSTVLPPTMFFQCVTHLGLKVVKNKADIEYAIIDPVQGDDVDGDALERVMQYKERIEIMIADKASRKYDDDDSEKDVTPE